eukprot:CAMPEP_0113294348 /NCGR_PEP_ID=MMETSP0008_2-20120614/35852_1 /TAXON_ID=97485 /ORGANISM="Prymnesium parvum" /LENGTH=55 /DNA_ID=CAMNT_0000146957 /DNA_START=1 /DNA_END=164 /DNA_ORIENTATION=+ /assembly_acc=CAM_ASM_000153
MASAPQLASNPSRAAARQRGRVSVSVGLPLRRRHKAADLVLWLEAAPSHDEEEGV